MKKTTLAALLLCSAGFWSGAALAAASCGFQNVIGVALVFTTHCLVLPIIAADVLKLHVAGPFYQAPTFPSLTV